MRTTQVTPPTVEPLTLAETKEHLRVDFTDEDDLITKLIISARETFEEETGLQLTTSTWRGFLDRFPRWSSEAIEVARPPLLTVVSVLYVDSSGTTVTWDSAEYDTQVFAGTKPQRGMISPKADFLYPTTRRVPNAVTINFTNGFGALAADVPQNVKQALFTWIGHLYKHREAFITGTIVAPMPGLNFDAWKELDIG